MFLHLNLGWLHREFYIGIWLIGMSAIMRKLLLLTFYPVLSTFLHALKLRIVEMSMRFNCMQFNTKKTAIFILLIHQKWQHYQQLFLSRFLG